MKKLLLLILITFLVSSAFGQEGDSSTPFYQTDDFYIKLVVAVVSAVLSFLAAFFWFLRNKKEKDVKQISYDIETKELFEISAEIKKKLLIQYNGNVIPNLTSIICVVKNTGNTLIKNQEIRFKLNSDSQFVESTFDPKPERELKVQEIDALSEKERLIKIGHLDKDQKLTIKFMTSGETAKIELYPFNEEGGVEFNSDKVTKVQDEKEKLYQFFIIIFLLIIANLTLPHVELPGQLIVGYFNYTLKDLTNLIIFILSYKDISSGLRILANRFLEKITNHREFKFDNTKNVIVDSKLDIGGNALIGDKLISSDDEEENHAEQSAKRQ